MDVYLDAWIVVQSVVEGRNDALERMPDEEEFFVLGDQSDAFLYRIIAQRAEVVLVVRIVLLQVLHVRPGLAG